MDRLRVRKSGSKRKQRKSRTVNNEAAESKKDETSLTAANCRSSETAREGITNKEECNLKKNLEILHRRLIAIEGEQNRQITDIGVMISSLQTVWDRVSCLESFEKKVQEIETRPASLDSRNDNMLQKTRMCMEHSNEQKTRVENLKERPEQLERGTFKESSARSSQVESSNESNTVNDSNVLLNQQELKQMSSIEHLKEPVANVLQETVHQNNHAQEEGNSKCIDSVQRDCLQNGKGKNIEEDEQEEEKEEKRGCESVQVNVEETEQVMNGKEDREENEYITEVRDNGHIGENIGQSENNEEAEKLKVDVHKEVKLIQEIEVEGIEKQTKIENEIGKDEEEGDVSQQKVRRNEEKESYERNVSLEEISLSVTLNGMQALLVDLKLYTQINIQDLYDSLNGQDDSLKKLVLLLTRAEEKCGSKTREEADKGKNTTKNDSVKGHLGEIMRGEVKEDEVLGTGARSRRGNEEKEGECVKAREACVEQSSCSSTPSASSHYKNITSTLKESSARSSLVESSNENNAVNDSNVLLNQQELKQMSSSEHLKEPVVNVLEENVHQDNHAQDESNSKCIDSVQRDCLQNGKGKNIGEDEREEEQEEEKDEKRGCESVQVNVEETEQVMNGKEDMEENEDITEVYGTDDGHIGENIGESENHDEAEKLEVEGHSEVKLTQEIEVEGIEHGHKINETTEDIINEKAMQGENIREICERKEEEQRIREKTESEGEYENDAEKSDENWTREIENGEIKEAKNEKRLEGYKQEFMEYEEGKLETKRIEGEEIGVIESIRDEKMDHIIRKREVVTAEDKVKCDDVEDQEVDIEKQTEIENEIGKDEEEGDVSRQKERRNEEKESYERNVSSEEISSTSSASSSADRIQLGERGLEGIPRATCIPTGPLPELCAEVYHLPEGYRRERPSIPDSDVNENVISSTAPATATQDGVPAATATVGIAVAPVSAPVSTSLTPVAASTSIPSVAPTYVSTGTDPITLDTPCDASVPTTAVTSLRHHVNVSSQTFPDPATALTRVPTTESTFSSVAPCSVSAGSLNRAPAVVSAGNDPLNSHSNHGAVLPVTVISPRPVVDGSCQTSPSLENSPALHPNISSYPTVVPSPVSTITDDSSDRAPAVVSTGTDPFNSDSDHTAVRSATIISPRPMADASSQTFTSTSLAAASTTVSASSTVVPSSVSSVSGGFLNHTLTFASTGTDSFDVHSDQATLKSATIISPRSVADFCSQTNSTCPTGAPFPISSIKGDSSNPAPECVSVGTGTEPVPSVSHASVSTSTFILCRAKDAQTQGSQTQGHEEEEVAVSLFAVNTPTTGDGKTMFFFGCEEDRAGVSVSTAVKCARPGRESALEDTPHLTHLSQILKVSESRSRGEVLKRAASPLSPDCLPVNASFTASAPGPTSATAAASPHGPREASVQREMFVKSTPRGQATQSKVHRETNGAACGVYDENAALLVAAERGRVGCVLGVVDEGPSRNQSSGTTVAALTVAAQRGHVGYVRALLSAAAAVGAAGAAAAEEDEDGWTALHWAAHWGHAACARALLDAGADPRAARARDGWTPLHVASWRGHLPTVRVLLAAGADAEATARGGGSGGVVDGGSGWRPLHCAALGGHCACAGELLRAGADPTRRAANGARPVDVAAGEDVRRVLLEAEDAAAAAAGTAGRKKRTKQ